MISKVKAGKPVCRRSLKSLGKKAKNGQIRGGRGFRKGKTKRISIRGHRRILLEKKKRSEYKGSMGNSPMDSMGEGGRTDKGCQTRRASGIAGEGKGPIKGKEKRGGATLLSITRIRGSGRKGLKG